MKFSSLAVPGSAPQFTVKGVFDGNISDFRATDFSGKFLVIIFYEEDYACAENITAFHNALAKFKDHKCEVIAVSTDSPQCHKSWIKASRDDGGFDGNLSIPLLSDPSGGMAGKYDCFDDEEGMCRNAVVIIDNNGEVRHVVASSISSGEVVSSCLEVIKMLKKYPVSKDDRPKGTRDVSPVKLNLEKDWDVSDDPALQRVLNLAKMLGKTAPPRMKSPVKKATFGLNPTKIRRLVNPRAPVRSCRVTLNRNLSGYGGVSVSDLSKSQRQQIETLMKKVMSVAYMPEEITGIYQSMTSLNQRQRTRFLEDEVFKVSGDSWLKEPEAFQWKDGSGVFVNNYRNFLLWINREDQLRLVSAQKGSDLKYTLLRLDKALRKMEEAIQALAKRGFAEKEGEYVHCRPHVYGTGLEATFTLDLPGFNQAGKNELEQCCQELKIRVEPEGKSDLCYKVRTKQEDDDTETDIVERTVEAVEKLWKLDVEQQQKFGIKALKIPMPPPPSSPPVPGL